MTAVVLVVEADQVIRQRIVEVLVASGYAVHAVDSGAGARVAVLARPPAVALVALQLPDSDGTQLIEELPALVPDAPFPIISLGAGADFMDALPALRVDGIAATRPVDPDAVVAQVTLTLRRHPASGR